MSLHHQRSSTVCRWDRSVLSWVFYCHSLRSSYCSKYFLVALSTCFVQFQLFDICFRGCFVPSHVSDSSVSAPSQVFHCLSQGKLHEVPDFLLVFNWVAPGYLGAIYCIPWEWLAFILGVQLLLTLAALPHLRYPTLAYWSGSAFLKVFFCLSNGVVRYQMSQSHSFWWFCMLSFASPLLPCMASSEPRCFNEPQQSSHVSF